jgi:signal transduction histidine kinase
LGVFHRHGLTLYLAGDTADFTALVVRLMVGHLVALPFVLAAVAFGGWWLAKEALRPVKTMADATDSIRPEDLATRLPESSEDDEIGRLTRAFNRMLERLERGFQQATRFSSDASHELRTPLAVLRGSVEELLSDADLTEPQRVAVEELEDQVQHLISITSTLLLLARADAGRLKLQVEDTDLRSIVTDCLEDARILGEQREVVIECALSEPAPLQADEVRLGQAVLNLLDNAVKYNAPGGRVEVKLAAVEDGWSLRVGNSGPEIPAEARAGLFERFFRAGQHEDTPGAGLGLSLARELVRTHGGDIALVQSSNGWNEFEMTLPKKAK